MKLEINDIAGLKEFINSLSSEKDDIYISEATIRQVGNSCMLPMPKAWEGKRVRFIVTLV
jgi:putative transposon-encoded protein